MKHTNSKTQAVRDALIKRARPMSILELITDVERRLKQVIGKHTMYSLLSQMINAGELDSVGRGDDHRFYWFRTAP